MTFLTYESTDSSLTSNSKPSNRFFQFFQQNRTQRVSFWVLSALGLLAAFGYAFIQSGPQGLVFAASALIPFSVLIALSYFIVPRASVRPLLRSLALMWGAYGSTTLTFLIIELQNTLVGTSSSMDSIVVQAAIVEEFSKAVFLFAIFLFARNLIRTPLNGAVLGILIGAGFAFLENILYFSTAYLSGGWDQFLSTFFARAVMSFFIHPMSTMFTGLFLGFIASRKFSKLLEPLIATGGLLAAMTTHGLWNGFASLTSTNWNSLYFFFWFPYVAVMIATVIIMRRVHRKKYAEKLDTLAKDNYLTLQQARNLSDKRTRKTLYRRLNTFDLVKWEYAVQQLGYYQQKLSYLVGDTKRVNKRRSRVLRRNIRWATVVANTNPGV